MGGGGWVVESDFSVKLDNSQTFCGLFYNKIKDIIIKEKQLALKNGNFSKFCVKWENFTTIYDFRGPDIQMV